MTDTAVHRLRDVYSLSMFLQIYDVHVTARTGIVTVYRISILLDLDSFTVTFQAVLSQKQSLHLNIDSDLARMDCGREHGMK
jgi:hypothetical protein